MSLNQSAEENLQMIRSLMERTATYRAVSVPSAAWAGSLSIVALFINLTIILFQHYFSSMDFLFLWLSVLVLAAIGNTILLYRDSRRTGNSFPSPALLSALWAMLPAFLVAGIVTLIMVLLQLAGNHGSQDFVAAPLWMLLYGLALLGTQYFAPQSIIILGWSFLLSSFVALPLMLLGLFYVTISALDNGIRCIFLDWFPSALMAATFGCFHLVYAAAVHCSIRKSRSLPS